MNIEGSKEDEIYKFELKLYLTFKSSEPSNYIAFSIRNKNDIAINLSLKVSLEKRDSCLELFGKYNCFLEKDEERKSYYLKENLMKDPKTYLPEGNLIIVCDVTMDAPTASIIQDTNAISPAMNKQLALRYAPEKCFDPSHGYLDEFSDFTVVVDKFSFKCHKAILTSRSEVFHHMLKSNMKESQSDRVYIQDICAGTFSSLLIFLYTDNIEARMISIQLLSAADKYMVLRLKDICEAELSNRVKIENVCEYWYEAYLHGTNGLLESTVEFMARNWNDIKITPEFQELEIKVPEIVKNISTMLCDAFKI